MIGAPGLKYRRHKHTDTKISSDIDNKLCATILELSRLRRANAMLRSEGMLADISLSTYYLYLNVFFSFYIFKITVRCRVRDFLDFWHLQKPNCDTRNVK